MHPSSLSKYIGVLSSEGMTGGQLDSFSSPRLMILDFIFSSMITYPVTQLTKLIVKFPLHPFAVSEVSFFQKGKVSSSFSQASRHQAQEAMKRQKGDKEKRNSFTISIPKTLQLITTSAQQSGPQSHRHMRQVMRQSTGHQRLQLSSSYSPSFQHH